MLLKPSVCGILLCSPSDRYETVKGLGHSSTVSKLQENEGRSLAGSRWVCGKVFHTKCCVQNSEWESKRERPKEPCQLRAQNMLRSEDRKLQELPVWLAGVGDVLLSLCSIVARLDLG